MEIGFDPTKNEQSNRTIDVDKITMSKFKELLQSMNKNIPHGLVFYSAESKYKVISSTSANKLFKILDLGIDPITMHGLKHSHACVMHYKKVSILRVLM